MKIVSFFIITFYLIICNASASCPCHIPCSGDKEVCTCFGPCGDDGYGCKTNGGEYEFLKEIMCEENKWQIECIRHDSCKSDILDDTNPYAAYELLSDKENKLINFDIESNDDDFKQISSAKSMSWFGGNWFDFWGSNQDDFFANDIDSDDDEITIDDKNYDSLSEPQYSSDFSSQRTLQTAQQSIKQVHGGGIISDDDLGRNVAGYKIISMPLYILIICIISSAIIGMLMCAGFVYCGLHCCCPLPPSSPTLTASQRSNEVQIARMLNTINLGGSRSRMSDKSDGGDGIYHRMNNALHNATEDDMASLSPLSDNGMNNSNNNLLLNDEYYDSEDEQKKEPLVYDTPHGIVEDYDYIPPKKQDITFISQGQNYSDIDMDSDDEEMNQLSNLIQKPYDELDIADNDYDEGVGIDDDEHKDVELLASNNDDIIMDDQLLSGNEDNNNNNDNNIIYEEDDELEPLKGEFVNDKHHHIMQDEQDMLGMATLNDDDNDQIIHYKQDDIDDDMEISPLINEQNKNSHLP